MLDYTMGKENNFILSYEEYENYIEVSFADGTIRHYEKTKEKKEQLEQMMRKQLQELNEIKLVRKTYTREILEKVITCVSLSCSVNLAFLVLKPSDFVNILISFACIYKLDDINNYVFRRDIEYYRKLRNDLEKHMMFLENESLLNENIMTKNFGNLARETVDILTEESPLTLRQIDRVSLEELEKLLTNAELESELVSQATLTRTIK